MKLSDANALLRRALNIKGLTSDEHRRAIEGIARSHRHSIQFVASRDDETCVPFALRLTDDPVYRAVAGSFDIYAGKDFIAWLLKGHFHEIPAAQIGSLACYFSAAGWQHIGVVSSEGRVTSKWGTYPLYEHDFAEVSEEYGDCVRFFDRPSAAAAPSLFREYAHEQGLTEEDIAEALQQSL